jgi:hypothetical protein
MWKAIALAMCSGLLGSCVTLAVCFAANDKPAPVVDEKTAKEDWLPPSDNDRKKPATAFPELVVKDPQPVDPTFPKKRDEAFAKLCPRFVGKVPIKIEETDDTYRKLLKARLHQGLVEMIRTIDVIHHGSWNDVFFSATIECLVDMEKTCLELWSGQPKELIPWLEELVVVAKEIERMYSFRITSGTPPARLAAASRHRLRAEATLWKAKNAK